MEMAVVVFRRRLGECPLGSRTFFHFPEKRCYMCGVVGFEEFIANCMKCKSIFIHLYCMKTVQFIIPNDWVCEDCRETPKQVCSKYTGEVLVVKRAVKLNSIDDAVALASPSSLSKGTRHLDFPEKACKTVETPVERVLSLSSMVPLATSLTTCDVHVCTPKKPSSLPSTKRCRTGAKKHSVPAHLPSAVPEPSLKQKSCIKARMHAHTPSSISKPSLDLQSFKELFIPPAHTTSTKSKRSSSQGVAPCKGTLKASENASGQVLTAGQLTMDRYLPNHPASNATWKGSLRTSAFAAAVQSCDTVWGYPPAKVGKKAYEFSKKMPDVLHFEAIPRCTVWAKMFNDGGPDKNDIALYFFPVGNISVQHYYCLVSHLEKHDMVLKTCVHGIELLIFSSSFLDEKSKEINQAYYLWGLFVPPVIAFKKPDQNQHTLKYEQAVDMEIDMLGGTPTGKIEVAASRDSLLNCPKMSKAASQPVSETKVKPEKWDEDKLACPPGFHPPRCMGGTKKSSRF